MKKNFLSLNLAYLRFFLRFIKNFFKSIYNNFSKPRKLFKENNLDLIVISPGGVATTTLINYLKIYKKVNDEKDKDGYKHLSKFPIVDGTDLKIIYIYGTYQKIYNSLKKRNIFQKQMVKLGCPLCYIFWGKVEFFFFKLCIKKQIKRFKNKKNVFVLHFDSLWEKKKELKKFLEIDDHNFINDFPQKK
tara:strand:+ start:45 stop:611 length:567 start_codon:yes stop_codon:yes gene_type:complete